MTGRMAGIPSKAWREQGHIPARFDMRTLCGISFLDKPRIAEDKTDATCDTCKRLRAAWPTQGVEPNVDTSRITGNAPQAGSLVPDPFFDCADCGQVAVTTDEQCPAKGIYPANHRKP